MGGNRDVKFLCFCFYRICIGRNFKDAFQKEKKKNGIYSPEDKKINVLYMIYMTFL